MSPAERGLPWTCRLAVVGAIVGVLGTWRSVGPVSLDGLEGPLEHWKALRQRIHDDVCRQGYSERRGSFVQSYGGDGLDASLMLIPITGFADHFHIRLVSKESQNLSPRRTFIINHDNANLRHKGLLV